VPNITHASFLQAALIGLEHVGFF